MTHNENGSDIPFSFFFSLPEQHCRTVGTRTPVRVIHVEVTRKFACCGGRLDVWSWTACVRTLDRIYYTLPCRARSTRIKNVLSSLRRPGTVQDDGCRVPEIGAIHARVPHIHARAPRILYGRETAVTQNAVKYHGTDLLAAVGSYREATTPRLHICDRRSRSARRFYDALTPPPPPPPRACRYAQYKYTHYRAERGLRVDTHTHTGQEGNSS